MSPISNEISVFQQHLTNKIIFLQKNQVKSLPLSESKAATTIFVDDALVYRSWRERVDCRDSFDRGGPKRKIEQEWANWGDISSKRESFEERFGERKRALLEEVSDIEHWSKSERHQHRRERERALIGDRSSDRERRSKWEWHRHRRWGFLGDGGAERMRVGMNGAAKILRTSERGLDLFIYK